MPKPELIVLRNVAPVGSPACSSWTFPLGSGRVEDGAVVVGDPRDTPAALRAIGLKARTPRCPSPVIELSRAQWDEIHETGKATIYWLVDNGAFKAENLPPRAA